MEEEKSFITPSVSRGLEIALICHAIQCCQMAKFDLFLSMDSARVKGVGAQSKEGRDQILQRSVAEP